MEQQPLSIRVMTPHGFEETEEEVRAALATEGFGVLTEIDVAATMQAKLGVEMPAYKILGACNPQLAHRGLMAWDGFGVLLPCNVIIEDLGDHRAVIAFNPLDIEAARQHPEIGPVAEEVHARLERVLTVIEAAGAARPIAVA
ncbi:MAG: DUF302 domain-containing protein [Chloroflexota bacterium]